MKRETLDFLAPTANGTSAPKGAALLLPFEPRDEADQAAANEDEAIARALHAAEHASVLTPAVVRVLAWHQRRSG